MRCPSQEEDVTITLSLTPTVLFSVQFCFSSLPLDVTSLYKEREKTWRESGPIGSLVCCLKTEFQTLLSSYTSFHSNSKKGLFVWFFFFLLNQLLQQNKVRTTRVFFVVNSDEYIMKTYLFI